MDAFYASVEQRDNPELRGKPIAVGGGSRRGVTTTASYEARVFGVRSAMPGYIARQKCPHIIFVPPRFDAYKAVSQEIRTVFKEYTDLVEPLSLDEAYLDVTDNKKQIIYATDVAKAIQKDIFDRTQLTCSVGVSYCKFIAKIASDLNKPNGISIIKPHQAISFIEQLPIEKFFGIGKVTAEKMHQLGIRNGGDLKLKEKLFLIQNFGKSGGFFYDIVRGIDDRPVKSERKRKSLAVERTLEQIVADHDQLSTQLDKIIDKMYERIHRAKFFGKTLTLKIKNADFQILTRSQSIAGVFAEKQLIAKVAKELFEQNFAQFGKVRLIGLTVSNVPKLKQNSRQRELPF